MDGGESTAEPPLQYAAALEYIKSEHPGVWLLLSGYGGAFRQDFFDAWASKRSLSDPAEAAVYLRGQGEGGGGLEHRPSTIPAAGEGLFATRTLREGELVCVYRGKRLSLSAVNRLDLAGGERDYVMGGFGFLWHVDARESSAVARYINDSFSPGAHNVRFVKIKEDFAAKVIPLRDIAPGEELFVQYGEPFWKPRGILHPYGEAGGCAGAEAPPAPEQEAA